MIGDAASTVVGIVVGDVDIRQLHVAMVDDGSAVAAPCASDRAVGKDERRAASHADGLAYVEHALLKTSVQFKTTHVDSHRLVVLDDECGAERDVGSQLDVRTIGEGAAQLVLIHHDSLCPCPCQGEYREDEHHRRPGDGGWMGLSHYQIVLVFKIPHHIHSKIFKGS